MNIKEHKQINVVGKYDDDKLDDGDKSLTFDTVMRYYDYLDHSKIKLWTYINTTKTKRIETYKYYI